MTREKFVDVVTILFSLVIAGFLVAASFERWPWKDYQTLRIAASVALVCGVFFFVKRQRAIALLALANVVLVGVFVAYKGSRPDWIFIDRIAAGLMVVPLLITAYEFIRPDRRREVLKKIGEIAASLLGLVFWVLVIWGVVHFLPAEWFKSGGGFYAESVRSQVIEMSPWEDYTGTRWLTFEDEGNRFKIEEGDKTVTQGTWTFDATTNSVTLTSPDVTQTYMYKLNSLQAYLGGDPVDQTPIKDAWYGIPPSSD